jgi:serine/threonine-protein kinase RsbW
MKSVIIRKLIVDEENELFDAQGMKYLEFPSEYARVREFAQLILKECPQDFLEDRLLEQQLSEIIKNGIKHGNRCDPSKKLRVWYDLRKRARFIVEDEGAGFVGLDSWNDFFRARQTALFREDFDTFLAMASYRGPESTNEDGGNSLIAALEYWNGGMIFNERKNKVGVVRWFPAGAAQDRGVRSQGEAQASA